MITAFNPDNISAFGSLALVAILYQVLGGALAWIVREMFYVPFDFQWGILVVSQTLYKLPTKILTDTTMVLRWESLQTGVRKITEFVAYSDAR